VARSGAPIRRAARRPPESVVWCRMRLVSINVGRPREIEWRGKTVRTSIFKDPVAGPVRVHELNLAGDEQADLSVHGGADKAVYAYPSEHYSYWREQLPEVEFPWGAFGENLTTEGLSEGSLHIGDRLSIGSGEFLVTQPRLPCFKLGVRFGRPDMVKRFQRSARSGFYLAVLRGGSISPGDPIQVLSGTESTVTVADISRLYTADEPEQDLLRRAAEVAALPDAWREYFRNRLWKPDALDP
jgi:MOSC domain-containing protein YiiM